MAKSKVTAAELQHADEAAAIQKRVADQIEQAGRGLHTAMNQCLAGTATIDTVSILATVQAYVADAQMVLLESQDDTRLPVQRPQLLVPR